MTGWHTDLMKQAPELMTRALTLHNNVIRKARWANFGYTVEQEGDSYCLVFYEALDAVIFCLQVGATGSTWQALQGWGRLSSIIDMKAAVLGSP